MTKRAVGVWSISIKDLIELMKDADITLPDWMDEPDLQFRVRYDGHRIAFMGIVTEYETKIITFPNLLHQEGQTRP